MLLYVCAHILLFFLITGLIPVYFSAMPEIRADLFLAISKIGMCLLTLSVYLNVLLFWFPADQGLKKVNFITFLKLVKISYDSE